MSRGLKKKQLLNQHQLEKLTIARLKAYNNALNRARQTKSENLTSEEKCEEIYKSDEVWSQAKYLVKKVLERKQWNHIRKKMKEH